MAITVPYQPVPEVAPSTQAVQSVDVSVPIAAFGGTIASAIQSAGKEVEGAGKEIFQRAIAFQELENETVAKDADARYMQRVGEIHARFNALEGQAAVDAYPRYIRELDLLRNDFSNALPNDRTRKLFNSSARQTMSRTMFNGAGHAASQLRRANNSASDARVAAVRDYSTQNPDDLEGFDGAVATTVAETRERWAEFGQEVQEQKVREAVSRLYAERIISLARSEPLRAWEQFQQHKGRLDAADQARVEQRVLTQRNTQIPLTIAREVNPILPEGSPEEPLRDRMSRAAERAEAIAPGDEHFAALVQNQVRQQYNQNKEIQRNDQINRDAVLIGAINGNHGRPPTTVEELLATNAEVSGAWDNTPEPRRRAIMNMLAANSRGENRFTREGLARFQELKGLAVTDPTAFLNINVLEQAGMTNQARNTLANMQLRIRQVPQSDPHVNHAINLLRPMMNSAGINLRDNPTQYNQFVGVLQDALTEFQQQNNRRPRSIEEYNQIGSNILRTIAQDNAWTGRTWPSWLGGPSRTPFFEQTVPQDLMEQFENDPRWAAENRTPTAVEREQFRRKYLRERYQELFGKQRPATSRPAGQQ